MIASLRQRAADNQAALERLRTTANLVGTIAAELKVLAAECDQVEKAAIRRLIGTANPLGKDGALHSYTSAAKQAPDEPECREAEAQVEQKRLEMGNAERALSVARAEHRTTLALLCLGTDLGEDLADDRHRLAEVTR